jgi:hypothetical protein
MSRPPGGRLDGPDASPRGSCGPALARALLDGGAMSPKPSRAATGVLVAGVVASIATSVALPEWVLERDEPLTPETLDDARSSSVYDIVAELATQPIDSAYGALTATVELVADSAGVTDALLDLRLGAGMLENGADGRFVRLAPGGRTTVTLSAGPFSVCAASPCIEDYQLVIERRAEPGVPAITVSGTVTLTANGVDEDEDDLPPPGTTLDLQLVPRGPLP